MLFILADAFVMWYFRTFIKADIRYLMMDTLVFFNDSILQLRDLDNIYFQFLSTYPFLRNVICPVLYLTGFKQGGCLLL